MPKVDLKLYSTDAAEGKKQTTTITYINPDASNSVLKNFAQQLNALTTNTYVETDRVETVNVDTDGSRKQFRNVIITGATQGNTATISFSITASEEVNPAVFFYTNGNVQYLSTTSAPSADPLIARFTVQVPNSSGALYVGIREKTDFYSTFVAETVA